MLISHASKIRFNSFKLGFNSRWTKKFQMFKLDLEKTKEPEIKLPTSTGSSKKHESSRKTSAAAARSLQSCLTLCDPIDSSPRGSPIPGILQARTLEWVDISFSNAGKWKVRVKSLSRVRLLATPWTAAHQAPPSMGFSRQEYWSGVAWLTVAAYYPAGTLQFQPGSFFLNSCSDNSKTPEKNGKLKENKTLIIILNNYN